MKEDHDGAEPAAGSVAVRNLLRLAEFTGIETFRERAVKTVEAFGAVLSRSPESMPMMLHGLAGLQSPWRQVVIAGDLRNSDTQALLAQVRRRYLPNTVLLHAESALAAQTLGPRLAGAARMPTHGGRAAAYVCRNFTCQAPVSDAVALEALLKK
jgi:uncharacterized protein YyaL (SSP411 family)